MIGTCEVDFKDIISDPLIEKGERHFCSNACKGKALSGTNNPAFKESWIKICQECGAKYRYLFGNKGKSFVRKNVWEKRTKI